MRVVPTLADDIALAISCVQDHRDTLDIDTEKYDSVSRTIERLFKFYYQLIGYQR